jgi:transcriptional regulator GlxA family with amidase domain
MIARVAVIAAAVAACWVAAVLGGLDAARWCAAGCVAAATVVMRALTPPQHRPRTPRYGAGRAVVRRPYPRFDQLVAVISSAQRDRRYHDRVLTPLLDQIATEADEPVPIEALRADVAAELRRYERRD